MRGKQAAAAANRRANEAAERQRLAANEAKEAKERASAAERAAARATLLEAEVRRLRDDLAAATSDRVRELEAGLEAALAHSRHLEGVMIKWRDQWWDHLKGYVDANGGGTFGLQVVADEMAALAGDTAGTIVDLTSHAKRLSPAQQRSLAKLARQRSRSTVAMDNA